MTQPKSKPKLTNLNMAELEQLSRSIPEIEDPEMRRIAKEELQGFMNELMHEYDLPTEPLRPEKYAIDALAWIPNTVQTVGGEAALAAKRAAKGEPQQLKEAGTNILNAAVPFGEPGPPIKHYREELGGTGELFQKQPLPKNAYFNPTVGGITDFATGALTDPTVWGALRSAPAKAAREGMTAAELKEGLQAALQAERAKGAFRRGAESMGRVAVNPLEELGKILYRNRFKDADAAAAAANARPFSEVMLGQGAPGFTSKGIQENIRDIIANKEKAIDKIQANTPTLPSSLRSEVLEPLGTPEMQALIEQPGKTAAYQSARQDILDEFRDAAQANPSLAAQYEAAKGRAGSPVVNPETGIVLEDAGKQVPVTNMVPQQGVGVGVKSKWVLPSGQEVNGPGFYAAENAWAKEIKMPTVREFETSRAVPGMAKAPAEPMLERAPPSDILNFVDEPYTPAQLRNIARTYQQKAASSGFYSKPTMFDVKNKTQLKQLYENQALSDLQNRIGSRARELEMKNLDIAEPGLGGQVFENYKDIHSLLSGAPFLDKSFKGLSATPSSRASYWMGRQNPVAGAMMDIGMGAKNTLQTGAAKTLMSRPSKYIASPLLRTYLPNQYYEDYRNSPWSLMRQYGVEQ